VENKKEKIKSKIKYTKEKGKKLDEEGNND
jgi:hypothetical protein